MKNNDYDSRNLLIQNIGFSMCETEEEKENLRLFFEEGDRNLKRELKIIDKAFVIAIAVMLISAFSVVIYHGGFCN